MPIVVKIAIAYALSALVVTIALMTVAYAVWSFAQWSIALNQPQLWRAALAVCYLVVLADMMRSKLFTEKDFR